MIRGWSRRTQPEDRLAYFAIVFCAVRAGALRSSGSCARGRTCRELIELPVMLVVIVVAARWLRRRAAPGGAPPIVSRRARSRWH